MPPLGPTPGYAYASDVELICLKLDKEEKMIDVNLR